MKCPLIYVLHLNINWKFNIIPSNIKRDRIRRIVNRFCFKSPPESDGKPFVLCCEGVRILHTVCAVPKTLHQQHTVKLLHHSAQINCSPEKAHNRDSFALREFECCIGPLCSFLPTFKSRFWSADFFTDNLFWPVNWRAFCLCTHEVVDAKAKRKKCLNKLLAVKQKKTHAAGFLREKPQAGERMPQSLTLEFLVLSISLCGDINEAISKQLEVIA